MLDLVCWSYGAMSSLRATSLSVMRPPKPPCWRDFIVSTPISLNSEAVDVIDPLGRAHGARSPVADLIETSRGTSSLPGNKPSRLVRRPRARIHRTRSEHVIHAEDLPESSFTATLADTDPKGLRVRVPDGRLYVEENNRRCQNWLASIEAAEPLDEVDYTTEQNAALSSSECTSDSIQGTQKEPSTEDFPKTHFTNIDLEPIALHELIPGVIVEIPEETFIWDVSGRQQSPSSGEEACSACKKISHPADPKKSSGTSHCLRTACSPERLMVSVTTTGCVAECDKSERGFTDNIQKIDKSDNKSKLCCDQKGTKPLSNFQNNRPAIAAMEVCGNEKKKVTFENSETLDSPTMEANLLCGSSSSPQYSSEISNSELKALNPLSGD